MAGSRIIIPVPKLPLQLPGAGYRPRVGLHLHCSQLSHATSFLLNLTTNTQTNHEQMLPGLNLIYVSIKKYTNNAE